MHGVMAGAFLAAAAMGAPTSGSDGTQPTSVRLIPPRTASLSRAAATPELALLQSRLAAVARGGAGRVGFAAIDLTSGALVSVNGDQRFPMASTVKIAIAAAFLHAVQDGRLGLDRYYALPESQRALVRRLGDMKPYRSAMSGAQLIELMMTRSDNTAADILLHAVGGARMVDRWLVATGVRGQRIDRSIAELLDDHQATRLVTVGKGRRRHAIAITVPRAAAPGDIRDSSTPEAMAALLAKLRNGDLLDEERTVYLLDVMARCRTGPGRIRGLLPAGTPVAHKTGTMNGISDDVGIVRLPNGHEVAMAAFEVGPGGHAARDRNIARLARIAYDGFGGAAAYADRGGDGITVR